MGLNGPQSIDTVGGTANERDHDLLGEAAKAIINR
jgi:hypothetical protein